jgi:hypothetical protein
MDGVISTLLTLVVGVVHADGLIAYRTDQEYEENSDGWSTIPAAFIDDQAFVSIGVIPIQELYPVSQYRKKPGAFICFSV